MLKTNKSMLLQLLVAFMEQFFLRKHHKPLTRQDISISVSFYLHTDGNGLNRTISKIAKKGTTVLSKVPFNIYDLRTDYSGGKNAYSCLYMAIMFFFKENTTYIINRTHQMKVEINIFSVSHVVSKCMNDVICRYLPLVYIHFQHKHHQIKQLKVHVTYKIQICSTFVERQSKLRLLAKVERGIEVKRIEG